MSDAKKTPRRTLKEEEEGTGAKTKGKPESSKKLISKGREEEKEERRERKRKERAKKVRKGESREMNECK